MAVEKERELEWWGWRLRKSKNGERGGERERKGVRKKEDNLFIMRVKEIHAKIYSVVSAVLWGGGGVYFYTFYIRTL